MPDSWLVTIATASEALPSWTTVCDEMRRAVGYERLNFSLIFEKDGHCVFRTEKATLALVLIHPGENKDAPFLPVESLLDVCKRAWHWPEASLQMMRMKHQLALAVQPDEDGLDALDAALLMNVFIRGVVKNTDALGVYWDASGKIFSPDDFLNRSEGMNRQTFPVDYWVDFRVFPEPRREKLTYATFGLEGFGLKEMELLESGRQPMWVMNWLYNLSHFMIEKELVLGDGDTFGSSQEQKFWVSHEQSLEVVGRKDRSTVIRLHFDEPPPA